jgi:UDP-N-acetylmuramate dehydrogenase
MRIEFNFPLEEYNSYKLKSVAAIAIFPESSEELMNEIVRHPNAIIWGGGNNIILSHKYYTTPIIFIRENLNKLYIRNNQVEAMAGLELEELSHLLLEKEFTGFEPFCDIPGCVGGGIIMNAGSGDDQISNHLLSVTAFNKNTKSLMQFTKEECEFDYRESVFKKDNSLIVISAIFSFERGDYDQIKSRMLYVKELRHNKQPRNLPNAGSVFKRPEGFYVGTMIEKLGLKGYSIGDAQISEKHAGFIVNKGNATGKDILNLIEYIQKKVLYKFNVKLELEQIVI